MTWERFDRRPRAVEFPSVRVYPTGKIAFRAKGLEVLGNPERVAFVVDGFRWGVQPVPANAIGGHYLYDNNGSGGWTHLAALVHSLNLSGAYRLDLNTNPDETSSIGEFWEAMPCPL